MDEAERMGIELELKDISESEAFEAELMEKSGSHETPYLVDSDKGESLDESQDIIDHFKEHYAGNAPTAKAAARVHVGGSTCISCEG